MVYTVKMQDDTSRNYITVTACGNTPSFSATTYFSRSAIPVSKTFENGKRCVKV